MNWFLMYSLTCFLAQACFFIGMMKHEDKDKVDDAALAVFGASVWPLVVTLVLPIMFFMDRFEKYRKTRAMAAAKYIVNSDGTISQEQLKKLSTRSLQNLINHRSEIEINARNREAIFDNVLKEIAERELLA